MTIELIEKEDVIEVKENGAGYVGIYRDRILLHVERFKSLIKDSDSGEIEVKIKDIKNLMGEEFKDRNVNSFYMMLKTILIEKGINIKLHHHYGANLVMSFAKENEIRPSIEIVRERLLKSAKNAGYDRYADYVRDRQIKSKIHNKTMYDKDSKKYFVDIGRKYVSIIFPNAVINWNSIANQHSEDKGGYDWTSNGIKIKHIAGTLRHSVLKSHSMGAEDFERDFFQWGINYNDRTDAFILTAWDDSKNLELMKAWYIKKGEVVNGKEFWDRSSFLISTHDRSIAKYSKYEVDDSKLDLIRNKILLDQEIYNDVDVVENVDKEEIINIRLNEERIRKESILSWYSTMFR
jgi:uncharacterized protein (UPF0332 family)